MGEKTQGLIYGLVPHIGCIAFIIGSVLGVTMLTQFFKPLLMNPYFFHILVLLSLVFATMSSALYLRRNGVLSFAGVKRKWKYLSTMYGSTIGINLLLFLVVFPLLANVSLSSPSQTQTGLTGSFAAVADSGNLNSVKLKVDIPCSGHATLISGELKSIAGVTGVQFSLPNIFDVTYDSAKTSKQEILSLDVFDTYKATALSESSSVTNSAATTDNAAINTVTNNAVAGGSCGGSCGGGCGCGKK